MNKMILFFSIIFSIFVLIQKGICLAPASNTELISVGNDLAEIGKRGLRDAERATSERIFKAEDPNLKSSLKKDRAGHAEIIIEAGIEQRMRDPIPRSQ